MKFRKRPVVVDAFQWQPELGEVGGVIFNENHPDEHRYSRNFKSGNYIINTLEGSMNVSPGDWIITGVNGEVYPCKPDIFGKTYEAVS